MNIIYDKLKLNYCSTIHFNDFMDVENMGSEQVIPGIYVVHHELLKQDTFCRLWISVVVFL
jgi:hypothetical protein